MNRLTMKNRKLPALALSFALAACAGGQKSTETAIDEKTGEGQRETTGPKALKNETAPKPPSDDEMKAKQSAASDKAKKASLSERTNFAALVEQYETAKKGPPGIPAGDCSWARKFTSQFGGGPFAAQAHFNAGTILEGCGDVKGAEGEYNESLKANPGYGPALTNLGNLYYKQGNIQTAKQWFEKVVAAEASMQTAAAYNNLALITYNQARETGDVSLYKDAVSKLRRALAIDSNSVAAYALLAQIYYVVAENDRSKLDLAALVCKQAKETDDKYAPIYNTLGLINLKKKNVTGALKEFETAISLDPKFIEAHLNIGAIGLSSRQYEKAEKSFNAVLALQPNNFDATVGIGVAARGLKKFDEAEKWYRKAQELNSKNCTIAYNMGLLYQDYKLVEDNSNLRKAQELFRNFSSCGTADKKKVEDATKRIKDIDDTFAAIEEQKKMEAEAKKMQEESERMQKQMEEQQKQQEQQQKATETPKK
jgi:tetratricopeptide (TPR) repeat protein